MRIGQVINTMDDNVGFVGLCCKIRNLDGGSVKDSTYIEAQLLLEEFDVGFANIFDGSVFVRVGPVSIHTSEDCFFHVIEILCEHGRFDKLIAVQVEAYLFDLNFFLFIVVDLYDLGVNRNFFSRLEMFLNNRGHSY